MYTTVMIIPAAVALTMCLVLVGADVQTDVQRQINDASQRINEGIANAQRSLNNPPPGSVSVNCATDGSGSGSCTKTASSGTMTNGSGAVVVVPSAAGGPPATQRTNVQVTGAASSSFVLSSTLLMLVTAAFSRYLM